jgi:hypothetical protein
MFGRAAFIKAKPGCRTGLTQTLEQDVVPVLRGEKNFRGLIALVLPNERAAISISLWGQRGNSLASFARTFGSLMAWREWSWKFGWFKSRKSRNSISRPSSK